MRATAYTFMMLGFAGSFGIGLWMGRRGRRTRIIAASVCLGLIALRAFFRFRPDLELELFPFGAYVAIHPWWLFPFALCTLGIGAARMTTRMRRVLVSVFAGVVLAFAMEKAWLTAWFDLASCTGVPGRDGICRQTTPYSCGAAAAATLLTRLGRRATESEMASRCDTNALTGTHSISVCLALREMLEPAGYQVNLLRSDWDELIRLKGPALAVITSAPLVDHWVVVLGAREGGVALADPVHGRKVMGKKAFLRRWRRSLIIPEKPPGQVVTLRFRSPANVAFGAESTAPLQGALMASPPSWVLGLKPQAIVATPLRGDRRTATILLGGLVARLSLHRFVSAPPP